MKTGLGRRRSRVVGSIVPFGIQAGDRVNPSPSFRSADHRHRPSSPLPNGENKIILGEFVTPSTVAELDSDQQPCGGLDRVISASYAGVQRCGRTWTGEVVEFTSDSTDVSSCASL